MIYRISIRDRSVGAAAAKIFNPQCLSDQEVNLLHRVDHRNIVRFIGHFVLESTSLGAVELSDVIVMELADESVRDRLISLRDRGDKVEPYLRKNWIREVTSAVRYLHGGVAGIEGGDDIQPIVHGSITSTKCLLFHGVLKLSGAGISRKMQGIVKTAIL